MLPIFLRHGGPTRKLWSLKKKKWMKIPLTSKFLLCSFSWVQRNDLLVRSEFTPLWPRVIASVTAAMLIIETWPQTVFNTTTNKVLVFCCNGQVLASHQLMIFSCLLKNYLLQTNYTSYVSRFKQIQNLSPSTNVGRASGSVVSWTACYSSK